MAAARRRGFHRPGELGARRRLPGVPTAAAVEAVERFYAARGLEAPLADLQASPTPPAAHPPVQRDDKPDNAWVDAYRGRGTVPPQGRHVLLSVSQRVFVSIRYDDDEVLAIARGSLSTGPSGTWLGLAAVETAPAHRRRGLARRLSAEVAQWGRERGATAAFLQVATANSPAVALYEDLGFAVHHAYHYRVARSAR